MRLTPERKQQFLVELARHGVLARAARSASPHSDDQAGALQTFRDERERDSVFAAEWDAALEHARAEIEYELYRRAQEGWEEPVFGGRYREQIVGTVHKYSDRLLELRARAMISYYRDTGSNAARPPLGDFGPIDGSAAEGIGQAIIAQARAIASGILVLAPKAIEHAQD